MSFETCRIRGDFIEMGFTPLTQIYFLNMIREIEEDILRNCSKDDADFILESKYLVTG